MKQLRPALCRLALAAALFGANAHAALIEAESPDIAAPAPSEPTAAWLPATAAPQGRAFALAAGTGTADGTLQDTAASIGSRYLPTPGTASLWTFITSMRAQQQGDRFVILESNVSLLQLGDAPPAPVPLPGAVWLMVMGLLGFAGVRVTGQGASPAGRSAPAPGRLAAAL